MQITIDNINIEANDKETLLEAAGRAGITIPTLCHKDGLEHYSSCMVCMVKDNRTGNYIPSCSAQVQEGMNIDTTGEDVISLRKKALELLLSEHRAECEAPCRIVCPVGYNIPKMNRLLAAGNLREAIELSLSELNTPEIHCIICKGYCENACRRKKIDNPISIRNIQIFVSGNIDHKKQVELSGKADLKKELKSKFLSHIGKLGNDELSEWLKECVTDAPRFREIADFSSAGSEAQSCMHCDCRAAEDCRLRDLGKEFSLKDPSGKIINAPVRKKINRKTGLIFENAKCIKCGLCVRICEDSTDEPSLCFIERGFISIISEPLTETFDTILATQAGKCIEICPTGALSHF